MGESLRRDGQEVQSLEAMADQARSLERAISDYLRRHRIGDPTMLHSARKHLIEGRNLLLRLARRLEKHQQEKTIPPTRWRKPND